MLVKFPLKIKYSNTYIINDYTNGKNTRNQSTYYTKNTPSFMFSWLKINVNNEPSLSENKTYLYAGTIFNHITL